MSSELIYGLLSRFATVYPAPLPEKRELPCITYVAMSQSKIRTMENNVTAITLYNVVVWHKDKTSCEALCSEIEDALDGKQNLGPKGLEVLTYDLPVRFADVYRKSISLKVVL